MNIGEIKNLDELSIVLGLKKRTITYVLYGKEKGVASFYHSYEIDKKNGEKRTIDAPSDQLLVIQRRLAEKLQDYYEEKYGKEKVAQGYIRKRSIFTNADIHKRKRYILHYDLKDFFNSFTFPRVAGYFEKSKLFGYNRKQALLISNLVCYQGRLPQGAPTSPIITNFLCTIMDYHICQLTKKYKLRYSRYADDLFFSTNDKDFPEKSKKSFDEEFHQEIHKFGLEINDKKTFLEDNHHRQQVTGLIVNNKVNISRDYYRTTRAMAYHYYLYGTATKEDKAITARSIQGRFSYLDQIQKFNHVYEDFKIGKITGMQREYRKFLFYINFYVPSKPVIITEGKTDPVYIKTALIKHADKYPDLIQKAGKGYKFNISFLPKSDTFCTLFGISSMGAFGVSELMDFFTLKGTPVQGKENLFRFFYQLRKKEKPTNPVIVIFDNEKAGSKKPLHKFLNRKFYYPDKESEETGEKLLGEKSYIFNLCNTNLTVLPLPPSKTLISSNRDKNDFEIEDLFDPELLKIKIDGRTFDRHDKKDSKETFGKKVFADYVSKNKSQINFEGFLPLLDKLNEIIKAYKDKN